MLCMRFPLIVSLTLLILSDSPLASPPLRPFHSPIVPAILGTWQAGQVLAVDFKTGQMHVDHSPINPDLSDPKLMPYGQRIEFTNGYDKVSNVAYWQVIWLVPYPPNACQYPFLQYQCSDVKGVLTLNQTLFNLEFSMEINSEDIESFFPVGAVKTGRVYTLRCGGNDEWTPELYVSKDRQRMWSTVAVENFEKYSGFQEYHRLAEYKPR